MEDQVKIQNTIIESWAKQAVSELKSNVGAMFLHKTPYVVRKKSQAKSNAVRGLADAKQKGIQGFVLTSKNKPPKLKTSIKAKVFRHFGDEIDGVSITFARHGIFLLKGAGPGNRTPKDWLLPVVDRKLPELADKLGEMNANALLKQSIEKLKLR